MDGLFVTGTDTGVGKTWVSAAIAAAARAQGHPIQAVKPIATGGKPPGEDAILLAQAAGHAPLNHTCLPAAASPSRAAREAGVLIDPGSVLRFLGRLSRPILVEGVGGWEVPVAPDLRVSDLAVALGLPVLVVAANRLGVLNHTLLTVAAIKARGLPLAGVVLNDVEPVSQPLGDWNLQDLCSELSDPVVPFEQTEQDLLAHGGLRLLNALQHPWRRHLR